MPCHSLLPAYSISSRLPKPDSAMEGNAKADILHSQQKIRSNGRTLANRFSLKFLGMHLRRDALLRHRAKAHEEGPAANFVPFRSTAQDYVSDDAKFSARGTRAESLHL